MILVFSVHADDAIFSCGEYIARTALEDDVWVVNLCAMWPPRDEEGGQWQTALNAEHWRACKWLGATACDGPFTDGKWGEHRNVASATIAIEQFLREFEDDGPTTILVPLGIHHPDHLFFAPILWDVALRSGAHVAVYEDLPYRVMYPEEVHGDLGRLSDCAAVFNYWPENSIANGGFVKQKLEACALYESQWSPPEGDAPRCCSAPERIWQLR